MNILFSAGFLSSVPFANNNIEILLADVLSQKGHNCYVTGISLDDDIDTTTFAGTVIRSWSISEWLKSSVKHFEKTIEEVPQRKIKSTVLKYILTHPVHAFGIFVIKTGYPYKTADRNYIKRVQRIIKEKKIDAVIGFCYPFDKVNLLFNTELSIKKIYYQFDPHGLHETLPLETKGDRMDAEISIISKSDYTFTTQVLARQYAQTEGYKDHIHKIKGVDFPVMAEKHPEDVEIPFEFKEENTNILFCGTMDDGFRNPDYVLSTFAQVFEKDPSVKVYFLGPQQGVKVTQWAEKYPDNIFVHPGVPNNIAVAATYKADMLLNIGNAISNMVPSKIFDYFATGKAIVNVQKIENAPDVEYFEKYPMQITLPEYSGEVQAEKLYQFIKENKGRHLEYSQVKDLYYTATPEYVASLIENALK